MVVCFCLGLGTVGEEYKDFISHRGVHVAALFSHIKNENKAAA
jgi:hypothetical protein